MVDTSQVLRGGRYRLSERLAVGGMGEIWRGDDDVLGRPVAIKVLRAGFADDADFRERFRAEARHAARLTHPNITQVYDFVDDDTDAPCIVMEYVAGESLASILDRDAPLDPDQTWSILGQAAAALAAAHRVGIVHRDIKPGNILVCSDGLVKVTDFGIARAFDDPSTTQPRMVLGTASYLAPEQLAGEQAVPASDMYALGVVGFECLTGRPPFHGDTPDVLHAHQMEDPPSLPSEVPHGLADLIVALLAKDPADRPRAAAAIASQAQRMADPHALHALVESPAPDEPYRAEPPAAAPMTTADPLTRVLTASRPQREPWSAFASSIAAGARRGRGWRDVVRGSRAHPTAVALGTLVVVVVVATLLINHVLSTVPSARHAPKPAGGARSASPSVSAAHRAAVSGVSLVGGGDHPEELHNVTDASASSAWYTEHYASAAFGNLKPGIGLRLRVSPSAPVKVVVIRFANPGIAVRLYASTGSSSAPRGTLLAATSSAPAEWRIALPRPVRAASWLIWITRLAPDSGGYRAGVAAVRFLT